MTDLDLPLDTLAGLACAEGGWGYAPGQPPHIEPTCLALLALAGQRERHATVIASGEAWLRQCSAGDGTYRLGRGRHEAAWPTALVLFTLAELGAPREELEAGARALLALRGRHAEIEEKEEINDIDGSLVGWPWAEGNFSWIEPTAWACLALTRLGQGDHPRVQEGRKLLLNRVLEGGGVNYGNRRIFGVSLEPIPTPTALALLALQGTKDERIARSADYLRKHALHAEDLEHLGWAVLALDVCGRSRSNPSPQPPPRSGEGEPEGRNPSPQPPPRSGEGEPEGRNPSPQPPPRSGEGEPEGRNPSPQPPPRSGEGEPEGRNPSPQPPPRSGEGEPERNIPILKQRVLDADKLRAATPYVQPAPLRHALMALALDVERRNPFRLPAAPVAQAPLNPGKLVAPRRSLGDRFRSFAQGLAVTATTQLRPVETPAPVHIAPVSDYNADIADVVRRQYESFRTKVPLKGKRVVLKPNLVEYHRDKVINTHPHLIAAVIELCRREEAAEVIVAEGPGHWRNVEYLVAASGLGDVLRHYKVGFVDLNHDEPVKRINLGRLTKLEHLYLSRTVASAEVLISLPKLKTHHWAVATLSLKNLFGTLPGICYGWPKNELHWRGIDNSIVDIALTRTPDLAIVDGIVGMEGDGPLNGTPKHTGVVIMGSDLVAVDATCCRLMKLDPEKVAYLVMGNRKKLGALAEGQIQQQGETIAGRAQAFETVEHFRAVWMGRSA